MNVDVIIIDDDPSNIFLHQMVVKKSQLNCDPKALKRQAALIILMPRTLDKLVSFCWTLHARMSGWELLKQIKLKSYAEYVFVIIISSSNEVRDRKKAETFNEVIGYLEKPSIEDATRIFLAKNSLFTK